MALDWDILNEDFANISAWSVAATGGGVASAVTFDGKSCLKLDFPTNSTVTPGIIIVRRVGLSIPTTCTVETKVYFARDGVRKYGHYIRLEDGTHDFNAFRMGRACDLVTSDSFSSVSLNNGTSYIYQITGAEDSYLNNWITYRFVIKSGVLIDIWGNNVPYAFDFTSSSVYTDNRISIYTAANTGGRATLYVDYIKIDTTPEGLGVSPVSIGDEKLVCSYAHNGLNGRAVANDSKLRVYNKDIGGVPCVCSVPLVAIDDDLASKVRIYDGSAIKSLKKIPT